MQSADETKETVTAEIPETELKPETAKASSASAPIALVPGGEASTISAAVRRTFAQVGTLQGRTEDFHQAAEQLDRLGKSVTKIFGPLRTIYSQMAEVAGSFDALCALESELASLTNDFEPMRLLHNQVSQLTSTVQSELGQLVKSLDPVKELNDKVSTFARSLRQVSELHTDLSDLYSNIRDRQKVEGNVTQPSEAAQAATLQ